MKGSVLKRGTLKKTNSNCRHFLQKDEKKIVIEKCSLTSLWIENRTTIAHESGYAWIHLNCYSNLCKKFKKERVLWITISKIGVHNGVQKGAHIEMQRERNIIYSKRAHKEAQKITEIGFWIVHEGVLKGA